MDPALLLVAGLAIILLLQFSRIRRQQRDAKATQAAVQVGAEVLTASGMIGTVVETTGASVTLAGEDGQRTRWVTAAVVRVLPDTDPASSRYQDPAAPGPGATDPAVADPVTDLDHPRDTPTDPGRDDAPGTTGSTRQD